jgi:sporulation-control protein
MSRFLSRIGIGAATVETRLPEREFTPGETVEATIEIEGGSSEQPIDELYLALLTRVGEEERVVAEFKTAESTTVPAGESQTVSTELTIPSWTPITMGDARVWLKTGLDISWAVDPSTEEELEVAPGPYVEGLLAAVEELGFDYRDSELREPAWLEEAPFVQAFRFTPSSEPYRSDVDDLTIVCQPREGDLKTVVEIDEREAAEEFTEVKYDEQEVVHVFETTNEDMLRRQLESLLDQYVHT